MNKAEKASLRVLRGGSWSSTPEHCRLAVRNVNYPILRGGPWLNLPMACLSDIRYRNGFGSRRGGFRSVCTVKEKKV
jgi:hypothetical protein